MLTTVVDGMDYLRGSADDWDRYARVTNDKGWSWNGIQAYLRKVSHLVLFQVV